MALAQAELRFLHGKDAERASGRGAGIEINPESARGPLHQGALS